MESSELLKRRENLGLTQEELAELLGVKRNTVYRWESGKLPISKTVELAFRMVEIEIKKERFGIEPS